MFFFQDTAQIAVFQCYLCDRGFTSKHKLGTHFRNAHPFSLESAPADPAKIVDLLDSSVASDSEKEENTITEIAKSENLNKKPDLELNESNDETERTSVAAAVSPKMQVRFAKYVHEVPESTTSK